MTPYKVHFIGIAGVGVSALARIALHRGFGVSGSDPSPNALTAALEELGAVIACEHSAETIRRMRPDLVVYTDALAPDNPELAAAMELGIPLQRRSEYLGQLMAGCNGPRIAVAGTHGKTTTTAMLAHILTAAGRDPTALIGGEYGPFGGNVRLGSSGVFLTEACEAFRSFHALAPDIAIITNIESDHLDCYIDESGVIDGFAQFIRGIRSGGSLVLFSDDANSRRAAAIGGLADGAVVRVGMGPEADADIVAEGIEASEFGMYFEIAASGIPSRVPCQIRVPGLHNVRNAIAAIAAAHRIGVDLATSAQGLADFSGVGRRFEILGERNGVVVVDDYAHHPTEIAATIAGARARYPDRRILAVFQPHLYSRTRDFLEDFARELAAADIVILSDIYPARESPIEGVDIIALAAAVARAAPLGGLHVVRDRHAVPDAMGWITRPGDVVLIMGAGNIREAGVRYISGQPKEVQA